MKISRSLTIVTLALPLALTGTLLGCSGEPTSIEGSSMSAVEERAADEQDEATEIVDLEAPTEDAMNDDDDTQDAVAATKAVGSLTEEMDFESIIEDPVTTSDERLTDEERWSNSLMTLNYLTVLSQEVSTSKNSRIKLEELYEGIFDNTRPDRIDRATLDQLISLSDTIDGYRMVDSKRARIEYLYEQQRAEAVRNAIPDPVSVLSVVRSRSIPQMLLSFGYMTVDTITGYQNAVRDADLDYLLEGWELEDEQSKMLHNQRKSEFVYMVEMVNDYDLPGDLALSEGSVEKLVSWENNTNTVGRIQFLEANVDTYKAYGGYWLILSKSYYDQGDYQKCLDAVASYEAVRPSILRKDYDYAAILPFAIASASETMDDDAYVEYTGKRAAEIVSNTDDSDWELRYIAAQAYIDLYSTTEDQSYLEIAYKIELNCVNELANKQRSMNREYLSAYVEVKVRDDATKNEKNEVRNYNKKAKAEHDLALPPVCQPLLVNCDMLFALVDELGVSDARRARIDGVLHPNGDALFLTKTLDDRYRMSESAGDDEGEVTLEATKITLPADLLSADSVVTVAVGKGGKTVPGEWVVKKVKRGDESDVGSYEVTLENKEARGSYADGDVVTVTIADGEGEAANTSTYKFKAKVEERFWLVPDAISFERA